MKYLKLLLIFNTLMISFLFSSGQEAADDEVRTVSSKTNLKITKEESPKTPADDSEPLPGKIVFVDSKMNEVVEAKDGDSLRLDIKVMTTKTYQDGRITRCEIYETSNPTNRKSISTECEVDTNIINQWNWDKDNQKFMANFKASKLSGSASDDFTIECSAIICGRECAAAKCPAKESTRKRRRALWFLKNKLKQIFSTQRPNPAG